MMCFIKLLKFVKKKMSQAFDRSSASLRRTLVRRNVNATAAPGISH